MDTLSSVPSALLADDTAVGHAVIDRRVVNIQERVDGVDCKQGNCIRYVRSVELLSDHLSIKNIGQNNVA